MILTLKVNGFTGGCGEDRTRESRIWRRTAELNCNYPYPTKVRYLTTWLHAQIFLIKLAAEHPIGTLSPCGTSIVTLLPAEFEPLTVATTNSTNDTCESLSNGKQVWQEFKGSGLDQ